MRPVLFPIRTIRARQIYNDRPSHTTRPGRALPSALSYLTGNRPAMRTYLFTQLGTARLAGNAMTAFWTGISLNTA
jgi:hypothetical protein